jgi:hypothetical protein
MPTRTELPDLSADAVARRLEQVRALYRLMVALRDVSPPRRDLGEAVPSATAT